MVVFLSEKIMHEEKREKEQSIEKKKIFRKFSKTKNKKFFSFLHTFLLTKHTP